MSGAEGKSDVVQGSAARQTVQLGADYLEYARERYDARGFKDKLVERLLPTVPRKGHARHVRSGQTFGKFQILDRLGKGGMAYVYLALDPERGTEEREASVALKVMKDEISTNPDYVLRFLREAANTALIEHRNVVSVLELGSVDGRLYYTMELIEGVTLKEHLRAGPVPEEEGVQILCQLVDGLVAAHDKGVAHRDIKPANVMILTSETRFGVAIEGEFDVVVKITDFGLARQLELDKSAVKPGGQFLGTAKYVAPEVIRGAPPTVKSDVFSLGILAFSMFAGESPFKARSKIEFVTANLEQEAPFLRDVVPVSPDLSQLVDRMLVKDPEERPDAKAVGRDLYRLARRKGREPITVSGDPESTFSRGGRARRSRPGGGTSEGLPLPLVIGGGVLSAGVVLSVLSVLGGGGPPPPPSPTPSASLAPSQPRPSRTRRPPAPSPSPRRRELDPRRPLAAPVELPPSARFRDKLARSQFLARVQEGDEAWGRGDGEAALAGWRGAAQLLTGAPSPELAVRLRAAGRKVGLARAKELLRLGDPEGAAIEAETALQVAEGDRELEALAREARARLSDLAAVEQGIRRAKSLAFSPETRDQAIELLRELLPVAARVGKAGSVRAELARLGVQVAAPSPTPGPGATPAPGATPTPPARSPEVTRYLGMADKLLRERSYDAAALAISSLRDRLGEGAEVSNLRIRLARGRATPKGQLYLEESAPPEALPRGFYAGPEPVTHRAFFAWFEQASSEGLVRPPRSWRGARPPERLLDEPVDQVGAAEAKAFARAAGGRLPSAAERALLAAALEREVPGPDDEDKRYPRGFFVVSDVR